MEGSLDGGSIAWQRSLNRTTEVPSPLIEAFKPFSGTSSRTRSLQMGSCVPRHLNLLSEACWDPNGSQTKSGFGISRRVFVIAQFFRFFKFNFSVSSEIALVCLGKSSLHIWVKVMFVFIHGTGTLPFLATFFFFLLFGGFELQSLGRGFISVSDRDIEI